jgi:hypothetical protein
MEQVHHISDRRLEAAIATSARELISMCGIAGVACKPGTSVLDIEAMFGG